MYGRNHIKLAFLAALTAGLSAFGQSVSPVVTNGLAEPYGVAVDADNRYFVTDSVNQRVAYYDPNTGFLTNFVGRAGFTGNANGHGLFARFFNPQGIARWTNGLYVADSGNHTIRFVSYEADVTTIAGGGTSGFVNANGLAARFASPSGLTIDANGVVYIADTLNNAVRRLNRNGDVTTVATNFFSPQSVAVGENGRIYVADTGNHSIKVIEPGATQATLLSGGNSRAAGDNLDSLIATEARFRNPRGVLWLGGNIGLLVADSGNSQIRRIYLNPTVQTYSTEVFGNSAGSGLRSPVGMSRDASGNVIIADLDANGLFSIQVSQAPQPPVSDPVIGIITITNTDFFTGTKITAVTNATYNNDVTIGVQGELGTQSFYTFGPTDQAEFIPTPTSTNSSPPPYRDASGVLPSNLLSPIQPDVTFKVISLQADRRPSHVVTARFRFQVANLSVQGVNPASFSIDCGTDRAELWYTTDGSIPTNNAQFAKLYTRGTRLNIVNGTNDTIFKARGFKNGYSPSAIVQQTFYYTNIQASLVGVNNDVYAGIGSTIVVPVELKPSLNDLVRSLQFRVEAVPQNGAPPLALPMGLLPVSSQNFIPVSAASSNQPAASAYTNLTAEGVARGLAIAYIGTNSGFRVSSTPATVALLSIRIPRNAQVGNRYRLAFLQTSGTADGIQTPVLISTQAETFIYVTNVSYVVGDTATASGYNAGTFGNNDLDNGDVNNAFLASVGLRVPFPGTDAFDAMDAFPLDQPGIVGGDGQIRFLDWQTILLRSLRLDSSNWRRSWAVGGLRTTSTTSLPTNNVVGSFDQPAKEGLITPVWDRQVRLYAGTIANAQPGSVVNVPVTLKTKGSKAISGLQFRVSIQGSGPAISRQVLFVRAEGIPSPSMDTSFGSADLVEAWNVGVFSPALTTNLLGYLRVEIPALAAPGQNYKIRFSYASGASDLNTEYQFDTFPGTLWVGTPALQPEQQTSDEWRTAFFGSADALLAADSADPDRDGLSNRAEYALNLDPNQSDWQYQLRADGFVFRWFAETGKSYQVETASVLGQWSPQGTVIKGDGSLHESKDLPSGSARFYRVREVGTTE